MSACILNAASPMQLQTIQAASVLLGLVPILLSTTGPSLTELALISLQRPVLAVLLSLATASVYPSRLLSFYDDLPRQILERRTALHKLRGRRGLSWLRGCKLDEQIWYVVAGCLEYLVVAVAAFNTVYTAWTLGVHTVSVLSGSCSWYPLLWASLPLCVHAVVCGAFHFESRRIKHSEGAGRSDEEKAMTQSMDGARRGRLDSATDTAAVGANLSQTGPSDPEVNQIQAQAGVTKDEKDGKGNLRHWERHLYPGAAHGPIPAALFDEPSLLVECAHKLGTILGYAQVVVGVIFFSSLLFITVADAAVILLRFLASAIVCRILLALELTALRVNNEAKIE